MQKRLTINRPDGIVINMNKTAQSEQTRNAILDAANRVLIEKGAECFTLEVGRREGGREQRRPAVSLSLQKRADFTGMMARSIDRVDAALAEELERADGDYLKAYIRASFRTTADPARVSRAIQAAIVRDPALLNPLRERFERMQREIEQKASTPELGLLVRLAMDGIWFSEAVSVCAAGSGAA